MLEGTFGLVALFFLLVFNVLADLVCFESDRGYCIPACPKVFSGEVSFLAGELSGNCYRALAFQEADDRRHRVLRRDRDEHVDMIRHDVAFQDHAFFLFCKFVEHWPYRFADVAIQDFSSPFRYKDNVIFAVPF